MMAPSEGIPTTGRLRFPSGGSYDRAYREGLRILARRSCSVARFRQRLERGRFPSADVLRVIREFRRLGYLDDLGLATERLRARSERKLLGARRLVRELRGLHIPEEVIQEALRRFRREVDEREILERALRKRLRLRGPLGSASDVRRLHQHLLRKGFEPDAIREAVRPHLPGGDPAPGGGRQGEGE